MSLSSGQIYDLIPKVMEDIGAISKSRKNEQQKYSFRGIEDFYQAAHPAMIKHGVFCAPSVVRREEYRFEKTNDFGKTTTWLHVTLTVEHRFYASDGSFVPVITCGEGLDNSDKATNKAMSGAMKYALIELFCVPTQDVEDTDRTSPENGRKHDKPVIEKPITFKRDPAPNTNSSLAGAKGEATVLEGKLEQTNGAGTNSAVHAKRVGQPTASANLAEGAAETPSTAAVNTPQPSSAVEPSPAQAAVESVARRHVGGHLVSRPGPVEASGSVRAIPTSEAPAAEYISVKQQKEFHAACRGATPNRDKADQHTYQWLIDNGYVNSKGEPSAKEIPASHWPKARDKAAKWVSVQ